MWSRLPPPDGSEMLIPAHAVGKVMGKGGANVDNIRKVIYFFIYLSQKKNNDWFFDMGFCCLTDIWSCCRDIWFQIIARWSCCHNIWNAWTKTFSRKHDSGFHNGYLISDNEGEFGLNSWDLFLSAYLVLFIDMKTYLLLFGSFCWISLLSSKDHLGVAACMIRLIHLRLFCSVLSSGSLHKTLVGSFSHSILFLITLWLSVFMIVRAVVILIVINWFFWIFHLLSLLLFESWV